MTKAKPFYLSKMFWVNIIAILAMVIQNYTSWVIPAGMQATILGVINLALRLVTKQPVNWSGTKTLLAVLVIPVLFTVSCVSLHDAALKRPVKLITCEYDQYVKADKKLELKSKTIRLHTSALLRKQVKSGPCGGGK